MPVPEFSQLANWPNLISVSRIALTAPTLYGLENNLAIVSCAFFVAIVVSDFLDGALARKIGKPNVYGTLIDHGSDAFVVVLLSAYFSHTGLCSWLLPLFIAIAFLHYAFDSKKHSHNLGPRPSKLGRINGISYFIFVAGCIGSVHGREYYSADINTIVTFLLGGFAWLLIATTALSIWQRTRLS